MTRFTPLLIKRYCPVWTAKYGSDSPNTPAVAGPCKRYSMLLQRLSDLMFAVDVAVIY